MTDDAKTPRGDDREAITAAVLRQTRDFFRRMEMVDAAEHCEQLALGIDSGVGECHDADCFENRHAHDPETDEAAPLALPAAGFTRAPQDDRAALADHRAAGTPREAEA